MKQGVTGALGYILANPQWNAKDSIHTFEATEEKSTYHEPRVICCGCSDHQDGTPYDPGERA